MSQERVMCSFSPVSSLLSPCSLPSFSLIVPSIRRVFSQRPRLLFAVAVGDVNGEEVTGGRSMVRESSVGDDQE